MRVLHVSTAELYGGIETVLVSIARHRALCPGLEHHFALCFEGRLADELRALGVPFYMLGIARLKDPFSTRRARKVLRGVIDRSGCDVAICHGPRSMIFFAATVREAKKPLVMWVHGVRVLRSWMNWLVRLRLPDLAVCNSLYTQTTFASIFPGAASEVIYYPLGMPVSKADNDQRLAIRRKSGTAEEAIVIVLVSRMVAWKGHRVLIDALAGLRTEASWQCWIVGGAQTRAEEKYCDDLGLRVRNAGLENRVRFLGQRADIPQILAGADIFCQPNLQPEPFGVVFIEAMLAGLPVVTSELGAAVEIVDPESGILVAANEPQALAQALHGLLADPALRQRLGAGGPARARLLCEPAARLRDLQTVLATIHSSSKE